VVRFPAQAGAILAGWRAPAASSPDAPALDVLQAILSMGEASRLRRRLVEETELAVSVHASYPWRIDPGVFLVFADLPPGKRPERLLAALWREIEAVAERGVSAAEVRRARSLLRSSVLHELATHSGVAHALGQAEVLLGDFRAAGRSLAQYAAVTPRDVRRVAAEWMAPARRNLVVLEPGPWSAA
jgi:zinc protease